jgi:hypothetical protein
MNKIYFFLTTLLISFSVLFAQGNRETISEQTTKANIEKVSPNTIDAATSNSSINSTAAVNVATYDFTVAGAAYVDVSKGNPPMIVVDNVGGIDVYAMAAGDANSDGNVTTLDLTVWLPDNNTAASGYLNSDMNMDGNTTTLDLTKWLPNNNIAMSTHVPN